MFKPGIAFLLFVALAAARRYSKPAKLVSAEDVDKEQKIRELFTGLGTDDVYGYTRRPFPYNDPSLFTDPEALRNFTVHWDQGFLFKYDVFTLNCKRTLRDTDSLYKMLNSTKDFNTFYQIANWTKTEVHPEMYVYALFSTIVDHPSTAALRIPPMYEVLPTYFIPRTVVQRAQNAHMNGVESRVFQINNTGWERTWHHGEDMGSPHVINQLQRRYYDVESRLSYFREDISRLDFIYKNFIFYGLAAPNMVKNGTSFARLGEIRYSTLRWILARYNLERYAVGLPPVKPINLEDPLSGYDPKITGLYGRPISGRTDNIVPQLIDAEGVANFEKIVKRHFDSVEAKVVKNVTGNGSMRHIQGIEAVNVIGNKLIGGDDSYYPSLYFNLLALLDGFVSSANRVGYSTGALLNAYTVARDPVYYQVLAYINNYFNILNNQNKPYTRKELGFPGVSVTNVQVSRLETYFENHRINISNLIPGTGGRGYVASQFRINHKQFSITVKVNSDRETNGVVKIFLGPATDLAKNKLSLNKFRESLILYYSFPVTIHSGENLFRSAPAPNTPDEQQYQDGVGYIHRWCHYPNNLMLPKGTKFGTPYKVYVIIYPYDGPTDDSMTIDTKRTCIKKHLLEDYDHTFLFPIDRYWEHAAINQTNHNIADTYVYHTDINRN